MAITWATPNINKWPFFIDGGLIYKGLIPGRDNDMASFAFAYGHYSRNIAHSEVVLQTAQAPQGSVAAQPTLA